MLAGIKRNLSILTIEIVCSPDGCLNDSGSAEFFLTRGDVQRMQAIDVLAAFLGVRHYVNRASGDVDDRRAENAIFGDIHKSVIGSGYRRPEIYMPQAVALRIAFDGI